MPKLVVDITPLSSQPKTGIGKILENIIEELRRRPDVDLVCFTLTARGYLPKLKKQFPELKAPRIPARLAKPAMKLAQMIGVPIDLFTGKADAALSVDWLCLPLLRGKTIAVVADMTPITNPEWHKGETIRLFSRRWKSIRKHADLIVAISHATKKEIIRYGQLPSGKILVAYPGLARSFNPRPTLKKNQSVKKKYALPEAFFLFVGSQQPRKNLQRLVQAFSKVDVKIRRKAQLVLAGDTGWGKRISKQDFVQRIGRVPDGDLPSLYALSAGLVYPSLKEGFGLPIVEAFAVGKPVLTSRISSMEEIGRKAAILVDPYSVEDISRGIAEMITQTDGQREARRKAGWKKQKKFSFENMVEEMLNALNR